MLYQRRISRIQNVPQLAPGFVGPGHLAAPVISLEDFALNDPFILLMDDHFDIGDRPLGGPHPHAGFETVTLLLRGSVPTLENWLTRNFDCISSLTSR